MKYYFDKINKSVFTIENFEYQCRENQDIEITKESYEQFINNLNNKVETEEQKLNKLRSRRIKLLEAFDKYKSNVNYGIVAENLDTRAIIVAWYNDLLNLVEEAFIEENIPSEIKYYLYK